MLSNLFTSGMYLILISAVYLSLEKPAPPKLCAFWEKNNTNSNNNDVSKSSNSS